MSRLICLGADAEPSASGEQIAEYLKSSCSCLSEQSPHTSYEEQAAEALQALRAGNPTKARLLFSATVERKHREGKAALQQAAAAARNHAALVRLDDPMAAVGFYRRATELDPENVDVDGWVLLETLLLQIGDFVQATEARQQLNQAAQRRSLSTGHGYRFAERGYKSGYING